MSVIGTDHYWCWEPLIHGLNQSMEVSSFPTWLWWFRPSVHHGFLNKLTRGILLDVFDFCVPFPGTGET